MYAFTPPRGKHKIRLRDIPTTPPPGSNRKKAERKLEELSQELFELQDLMYAAKTHSVLVVLQGRDAAGKDGTIKAVVGALNPRGVSVVSFNVPTEEELAHDFLWRVHRHAPRRGEFAIFNRSHYEDVLVVRVHGLVPEKLWLARYAHIDGFEELLREHGTIVLKFFLHISPEEQLERLLAREKDQRKAWKVNVSDWEERLHWEDYTEAYEEVLRRCSTPDTPWMIIPADAKWYRNLAVAEAIVKCLRPFRKRWLAVCERMSQQARNRMDAYRHASLPHRS